MPRVALTRSAVVQCVVNITQDQFSYLVGSWTEIMHDDRIVLDDTTVSPKPGDIHNGGQQFSRPTGPGPIDVARAVKFAQIEARTLELQMIGAEYPKGSGNRYIILESAVRRADLALSKAKEDVERAAWNAANPGSPKPRIFVWPLIWPDTTHNITKLLIMNTADDVQSFADAMALADRAVAADDAAMKINLNAAQTLEDIEALVDFRTPY